MVVTVPKKIIEQHDAKQSHRLAKRIHARTANELCRVAQIVGATWLILDGRVSQLAEVFLVKTLRASQPIHEDGL